MKTNQLFRMMFYIAVYSFVLTACKKGDEEKLATNLIEAEQLISMPEAESITGEVYNKKNATDNPSVGQKLCSYENDDQGLFQITLIQKAYIPEKAGLQEAKLYYDAAKSAFPVSGTLPTVGDDNFVSSNTLHIMCSGYYISINIRKSGLPGSDWSSTQKRAIYINAGKKACENLKKHLP